MSGEAKARKRVSSQRSQNGHTNRRPNSKLRVNLEEDTADSLVLHKSPLRVLKYSFLEAGDYLTTWLSTTLQHRIKFLVGCLLIGAVCLLHSLPGAHQPHLVAIEKSLIWWGWWVGLGVLSSVGLGTGLHTFLLYLGPHIAAVTLAAYECQSTDFPEPPYPEDIVCPDTAVSVTRTAAAITVWDILSKVRIEAFCWGAGTAIGELPPYFMARAARLSGSEPGEEEKDFLELQEKLKSPESMTMMERMKYRVQWAVQKVGFMGILLCASIPNPLFDLAGITCGHFLVPFWTFFGATLIGKAVIKMHIQKLFVILAFNEGLLEQSISLLRKIPVVGAQLETPVRNLLTQQKEKLYNKTNSAGAATANTGGNIISTVFEWFVLAMVFFFVVSIINSLAQSYHKRVVSTKSGRSRSSSRT